MLTHRNFRPTLSALGLCGCSLVALLASSPAHAQRPGFGPVGPAGTPQPQKEEKKEEGPAEAAPKKPTELVRRPTGFPAERRGLVNFELHGYFRFRWDLLTNLNLGIPALPNVPPPFPVPFSELPGSPVTCRDRKNGEDCRSRTFISGNLRLRLEPTLTVSEEVKIHTQIDLLDNIVLGSTPDTYTPGQPVSAFNRGLNLFTTRQVPPISGRNSIKDSVLVRRAYGEVRTEIGRLFFGRMPVHWGMGMLWNSGDQLISNCGFDCNFGDTGDRLMFISSPTPELTFGVGYEFTYSGLSSANLPYVIGADANASYPSPQARPYYGGQPFNVDRLDDIGTFILMFKKGPVARNVLEEERIILERADAGEIVFNYGFYFIYRNQGWDQEVNAPVPMLGGPVNPSTYYDFRPDPGRAGFLGGRNAYIVSPDLWARLLIGKFSLEAEFAIIAGSIGWLGGDVNQADLGILQFGGVLRGGLRLLKNDLRINFEVGFASGDQAEPAINQYQNFFVGQTRQPPGDTRLSQFRFNYDYRVDLILFREILGTVANATYFKPSIRYELNRTFGAHFDIIYSIANEAVATPGNSNNLGLELNLGLYYQNLREGFYFAIDYGVLFPFAALNRPAALWGRVYQDEAGTVIDRDAGNAQALRARLVIPF